MKKYIHFPLLRLRRMTYAGLLGLGALLMLNSCAPSTYTIAEGTAYQSYTPPAWAPQEAAVAGVQYYYLPDYGMYYDLGSQMYWYNNGGMWAASGFLPSMYSGINLNAAYIVLLQRGIRNPWLNNNYYVRHYPNRFYVDRRGIASPNRVINASSFSTNRSVNRSRNRPMYQATAPRASVPQRQPSYSAPSRRYNNKNDSFRSNGGRAATGTQSHSSGAGGARGGGRGSRP